MPGDSNTTVDWKTFVFDPNLQLACSAIPTRARRSEKVTVSISIKFTVAYNKLMFPAIFLDRDGVIIENRSDYVRQWSHVTVLPKAIDALSGFKRQGFKIVVVTNQSAIGRGLMTFEDAQAINERLVAAIKESGGWVDAVFMCPHKPEDNCECRKPQPGLLLQAAQQFSLDLRSSWMVGDAWTDLLAGQSAGVEGTIMVRTGRGAVQLLQTQREEMKPYFVCDDVFDAFTKITFLKGDKTAEN